MVLSNGGILMGMGHSGGAGGGNMNPKLLEDVQEFLKMYKPLECDCCDEVVAYVERKTGRVLCKPSCVPGDEPTTMQKLAMRSNVLPASTVAYRARNRELNMQNNLSETLMGKSTKFEMEYGLGNGGRDIVDGPLGASSVPISFQESVQLKVDACLPAPSASNQMLDNEVGQVSSSVTTSFVDPTDCVSPRARTRSTEPPEDNQKPNGTLRPAENLRKEGNPFIKKSLSPKSLTSGPTLSNNQQQTQITNKPAPVAVVRKNVWSKMVYSPNLKNGAAVKVAHVYSLTKYQVSAVEDELQQDEIQQAVAVYVTKHPEKTYAKLGRVPLVNDIVIGRYQNEDYYRGRVIDVREKDCKIIFLDYGDMDRNTFDVIYEPDEELLKFPIMSMQIELKGVPSGSKLEKGSKGLLEINKRIVDTVILQVYEEVKVNENGVFAATIWYDDENSLNENVLEALK